MALLDNEKCVLPLSSIAELLSTKARTLKMYEDKGLFPKKEDQTKKLYSINDIRFIAFVHYLASVKKINANGIKYILEILNTNMDENSRNDFLDIVEGKLEKISTKDVHDIDNF
ncbi:MerR family transcriptional regulator [Malaciobacter molluscorum LMG 25693]|uniref:MerR family transcriptional regulator n=1 Tax=Malaciobacter molluscorum LMG 25693 TaxID=870501 RepID=A0A2G1DHX6_9BACT|nr:MerR family transcriptional regulator [Malaciobacter molluscorum]AXX93028.1 transcriptional regulator, MerR family [Malaciobacter molluscorum LMG 25693]PHO18085.1 MerR family transcriptional regulator [Malaciobacter molluscorum LMG 25693]RXJ94858.1 MerR family transcriptional regulator [Malaciobacter molluscorum]